MCHSVALLSKYYLRAHFWTSHWPFIPIDGTKLLTKRCDEPTPTSLTSPSTLLALSSTSIAELLDHRLPYVSLQHIFPPFLYRTAYSNTVPGRGSRYLVANSLPNIRPQFFLQFNSFEAPLCQTLLATHPPRYSVTARHILNRQPFASHQCSGLLWRRHVPCIFTHIPRSPASSSHLLVLSPSFQSPKYFCSLSF